MLSICRRLSQWWLVFVLLGVMLLWVMGVGFENTCTVFGKWNEDGESVQDFIFWFCVWCKSRELGGRMSPGFPCVTPLMESFSSDLRRAIISYWTDSHLESSETSTMELFYENSQPPKDVNYFSKKALPQMFDWPPNAPPILKVL